VTTERIARAITAATAHLGAHPEEGRVADRAATVVLEQGLRCRAVDPVGHAVVTDLPAELGGADTGPTPGTLLRVGEVAAGPLERHSPVSSVTRRELPVTVEVDLAEAPPGS
jgi:hypothetical protein